MIHLVLDICVMTVFISSGSGRYVSSSCSATACSRSAHSNLHINSVDRCELNPDMLRVWTQEWYFRLLSQTNCDLAPWCCTSQPPGRHKGHYQPAALPSPRPSSEGEELFFFSSTTAVRPGMTTRQELSATCSPYCDPTSFLHLKREFPEIFTTCCSNIWRIWPQSPSCRLAGAKLCNSSTTRACITGLNQKNQGDICWIARLDAAGLTRCLAETVSSSGSDSRVARLHWKQHLASFPSGYPERRKAMGPKRKWNITTFPVLCDVLVFGGHHGNETLTPAASLRSQMTPDFQKQQQQRHISLPYLTDNHSCLKPRLVLVVSIKRHEAIFAACTSMCHMIAPSFLLLPDR